MTLEDARAILVTAEAIDGDGLSVPPDEPGVGSWVLWVPGPHDSHARLGGWWYTADELEAIAVWMRAHAIPRGKR